MDKNQAADALEEIAVLLELLGENPFKTRAYVNGARTLRGLEGDLAAVVAAGGLAELRGFGPALIEKVTELVTAGRSSYLQDLRAKVPPGLLDLLRIPGLGPKRVKEIHDLLGVATLGELEYACHENRLAGLPGFGEKMQARVLAGIAVVKKHAERFLLDVASAEGARLERALAGLPGVKRISLAGSLRRRRETVGDLDLVVATAEPESVMKSFVGWKGVEEVLAHGDTKSSVRLDSGLQVDLRAVTEGQFPFALLYFTGSKEHNVALRARAQKRGWKLNEYGLFREDDILVPCRDEAAVYKALGLAYVEPELREDLGEIAAAEEDALPVLLEEKDLRGVLHCHSTYSDGANTVREMALAARELGFAYIGMSDHSQSARYAHGMTPNEVKRQHEEIDRLNDELEGIRILKGVECDILADGELDYPDRILASFDFLIGSIHSRFGLDVRAMTKRLVTAIHDPHLDVVGHLTGRLLLSREPYALDVDAVLEAAAKEGVVVEINANPHRLDLDWRACHGFQKRGGMVSINPDAHRTEGLKDVTYGVGIARKGWLTKDDVLNALPLEKALARFSRRRKGRS